MKPILSHSILRPKEGEPERWLVFLHGIYGAGRNWQSIARRVVEARPGCGAITVDLRLHGGSQGFAPPHTLKACAEDVAELVDQLGLPVAAIAGHSFGGKVALLCGRTGLAGLEQIWVMDSTPEARIPDGDAWELLAAIRRLPPTFVSRQAAITAIEGEGYSTGLAQWMAMNLAQKEDGWHWRLDFEGLEAMLLDFFQTDLWQIVEQPPPGVELHFVKATDSKVLSYRAAERIETLQKENGRVFLHRISGGHWINVDNPQGVVQVLEEWLP